MKKLSLVFSLLIPVLTSFGQDNLSKNNELGCNLIILNPGYSSTSGINIPDQTVAQFFPGIFYRYNLNRFAFRANINYSVNNTQTDNSDTAHSSYGSAVNKTFDVKVGAQYSLRKHSNLVYLFADLVYKNVLSTGNVYDDVEKLNNNFSETKNEPGLNVGIGFKIKIMHQLYFNAEAYYDNSFISSSVHETNLLNAQSAYYHDSGVTGEGKLRFTLSVAF